MNIEKKTVSGIELKRTQKTMCLYLNQFGYFFLFASIRVRVEQKGVYIKSSRCCVNAFHDNKYVIWFELLQLEI